MQNVAPSTKTRGIWYYVAQAILNRLKHAYLVTSSISTMISSDVLETASTPTPL